ncbi:MAG: hypothetical protein IV100_29170 [Myxococcales bacterium]|nr:hypothetical protein [Myxococcales bacterium]
MIVVVESADGDAVGSGCTVAVVVDVAAIVVVVAAVVVIVVAVAAVVAAVLVLVAASAAAVVVVVVAVVVSIRAVCVTPPGCVGATNGGTSAQSTTRVQMDVALQKPLLRTHPLRKPPQSAKQQRHHCNELGKPKLEAQFGHTSTVGAGVPIAAVVVVVTATVVDTSPQ